MGSTIRDKERSGSGTGLLHGLRDILEDGEAQMRLASLVGVCAANNLGS
jgi:hypothetical protein